MYFSKNKNRQMSDSLYIGALLALVGGFLEAYTFICRGEVFANCQTGNLVLFSMFFIQRDWKNVVVYLVPIISFFIGICLAEWIRHNIIETKIHWRQVVVTFEMICLIIVTFIPCGRYDIAATTLVSFTCALQVEAFRKIHGNLFATTMCTGNLRSGVNNLFLWFKTKEEQYLKKTILYFMVIFFFMIGAVMGSVFTYILVEKAVLICCIPLICSMVLMNRESGLCFTYFFKDSKKLTKKVK